MPRKPPGIVESPFLSCYIPAAATGRALTSPLHLIPGCGKFWSDRDETLARAKERMGIYPNSPLDATIDIFANTWATSAPRPTFACPSWRILFRGYPESGVP